MTTAWINLLTTFSATVGWAMLGYDLRRTGRTPAVGRIHTPQITWQMDVSAGEYFLAVTPEAGEKNWELLESSALLPLSSEARRTWGLTTPQLDVTGNGQQIDPPAAPGARWGKFLPDVPGLQRLSWTTTWGENAHFQMAVHEAEGCEELRGVARLPKQSKAI